MKKFLEDSSHAKLVAILSAFGFAFLMMGNGIISMTHPDEVFYIQTAKEMIAHDSWMTPFIFDHPQFEKPIFSFWLFRAAIQWFGLAPFVARFWPAFFGMLGVVVIYWITWMLFGNKRTAFLSGIILGSSFLYIALSRAVLTDMIFSVLVVISIGFFYFAYRFPERKDIGLLLCLFFSALAVLAKAALGYLFPMAVILGYLFAMRDFKFLKTSGFFWGTALFTILTVPWHVLMVKLYGREFLWEYVYNIHIRRLFEAEHPKADNWYFYPGTLIGGTMPWVFFLFPAMASVFRTLREKGKDSPALAFLIIWIAAIFMFMQPAHSKLASYIFPAFPAVTIMIAYYLGKTMERSAAGVLPKGIKISGYLLGGLLFLVAIGIVFAAKRNIDYVGSMTPFYILSALLVLTAFAISFNLKKGRISRAIFSVCGVTFALLIFLFLGHPYAEPWVSCKQICDVFKTVDQSQTAVLASKFYTRGVRYYTDRDVAVIDINGSGFFSPHPIPFLNSDEKVLTFLKSQPLTYGIVKESSFNDLTRITTKGNLTMTFLKEIGGKRLVRIENANFR